jgi:hypothetical protein
MTFTWVRCLARSWMGDEVTMGIPPQGCVGGGAQFQGHFHAHKHVSSHNAAITAVPI